MLFKYLAVPSNPFDGAEDLKACEFSTHRVLHFAGSKKVQPNSEKMWLLTQTIPRRQVCCIEKPSTKALKVLQLVLFCSDKVHLRPAQAIWCYLCEARLYGTSEARNRYLKVSYIRLKVAFQNLCAFLYMCKLE